MLWDLKSFYLSSSIQEIKHDLRLNSRFLKFEARREVLNDIGNLSKPKNIQPPKQLWNCGLMWNA